MIYCVKGFFLDQERCTAKVFTITIFDRICNFGPYVSKVFIETIRDFLPNKNTKMANQSVSYSPRTV
jgi:hypothetical protein